MEVDEEQVDAWTNDQTARLTEFPISNPTVRFGRLEGRSEGSGEEEWRG